MKLDLQPQLLEGFFRNVAEKSLTGIFVHTDGIIVYVNPRLLEMFGYSKEETIGKHIGDFIYADDKAMVLEYLSRRMNGQESPSHYEFRLLTKLGTPLWIELLVTQIDYQEGLAVMGNVVDISESKRLKIELRKSTERYQRLFDNAQVGLFSIDIEKERIIECNEHLARIAGYRQLDELKRNCKISPELFSPGEFERIRQIIEQTGRLDNYETAIVKKNGREIWIRLSVKYLPELNQVEGVAIDITDERQSVVALRESEQRLRLLLESAYDMVCLQDVWGKYMYFNASSRFGFPADKLMGHSPYDIFDHETGDLLIGRVRKVAETSESLTAETCLTIGGEKFWFSDQLSPVRDAQGKITGVVTVSRNITDRRRIEQERQHLEEQLLQAQKMEVIGTLVGGIAHDFNNLLTGMLGNMELAERYASVASRPFLSGSLRAARRSADLVQKILDFSRKSQPNQQSIAPHYVVAETAKFIIETIDPRIKLEVQTQPELWNLIGDEGQIQQVIMNLTINAVSAIMETLASSPSRNGRSDEPQRIIKISLENAVVDQDYCLNQLDAQPGKYVVLAVSDNGPGMTAEVQERIFEPFFTTKGPEHGTGLGLATVLGIVKQHEGWIDLESEVGRGTTFRVYLPRFKDQSIKIDRKQIVPEVPGGNETIMIIDDEEMIRDLGRAILEMKGYRILLAADGLIGLELYRNRKKEVDLIILDLTMPHLSGWEVLDEIRTINPRQKVLLSSGYNVESETRSLQDFKPTGYVPKPYRINELTRKVRELLDS